MQAQGHGRSGRQLPVMSTIGAMTAHFLQGTRRTAARRPRPDLSAVADLLNGEFTDRRAELPPRPPVRPVEQVDPVEWAKSAKAVDELLTDLGV